MSIGFDISKTICVLDEVKDLKRRYGVDDCDIVILMSEGMYLTVLKEAGCFASGYAASGCGDGVCYDYHGYRIGIVRGSFSLTDDFIAPAVCGIPMVKDKRKAGDFFVGFDGCLYRVDGTNPETLINTSYAVNIGQWGVVIDNLDTVTANDTYTDIFGMPWFEYYRRYYTPLTAKPHHNYSTGTTSRGKRQEVAKDAGLTSEESKALDEFLNGFLINGA